jgi:hypothetical protein
MRSNLVAKDPTSTAIAFHRVMNKMFQHLIGLTPDSRVKKTREAVEQRKPGIYGKPCAFFGVYEAQGRGLKLS